MPREPNPLGNPGTLRVLFALCSGCETTKEIAEKLGIRAPSVSEHLRKLREVGIVRRGERSGRLQKYEVRVSEEILNRSIVGQLARARVGRVTQHDIREPPLESEFINAELVRRWVRYIWCAVSPSGDGPPELSEEEIRAVCSEETPEPSWRYTYEVDVNCLARKVMDDLRRNESFERLARMFTSFVLTELVEQGEKVTMSDVAKGFELGLLGLEYSFASVRIESATKDQEGLILPLVTWIYLLREMETQSVYLGHSLRLLGFAEPILPWLPEVYVSGEGKK